MSKRAKMAALKAYPILTKETIITPSGNIHVYNSNLQNKAFQEGYEQAERDIIPLINRLCEAILFDWEDKAELAWKIQSKIKEE